MAGSDAHFFNVQGTHTFLNRRGRTIRKWRVLLPQKIRFKGHHASIDKKEIRIIQDQRRAGHLSVSLVDKVLNKAVSDLMCLHGRIPRYELTFF